jgi:hypothetical protein
MDELEFSEGELSLLFHLLLFKLMDFPLSGEQCKRSDLGVSAGKFFP